MATRLVELLASLSIMEALLGAPCYPSDQYIFTIVVGVLGEALNWAPIMPRDTSVLDIRYDILQPGSPVMALGYNNIITKYIYAYIYIIMMYHHEIVRQYSAATSAGRFE